MIGATQQLAKTAQLQQTQHVNERSIDEIASGQSCDVNRTCVTQMTLDAYATPTVDLYDGEDLLPGLP